MAKKKKHAFRKQKIFTLIGLGLVIVLVVAFAVFYAYPRVHDQQRLDRINAIFSSLHLGSNYFIQSKNIFGDKEPDPSGGGRTMASSIYAIRGATVDTTLGELKSAISKTSFRFYDQPYPGSVDQEFIYKSPKSEYLRIDVSSKPRDDAYQNFSLMNPNQDLPASVFQIDPNSGPSNVYIYVNLDDNNI